MKKLMFSLCLLCVSIAANAQFEKGMWIINPSVTGLNYSHSSYEKNDFGIGAQVGAFVVDNAALLVTAEGRWTDGVDSYGAGVGGRYYFSSTGVYLGGGMKMKHWKPKHHGSTTDYAAYGEVGYAFFLSKTITIEPAAYYDLSFKESDYSKFGFKIGFGLYF